MQPGAADGLAGGRLHRRAGRSGRHAAGSRRSGPSHLASGLFAAIGALLGLLLAFNAMLLTVPERRQAIADLRLRGTTRLADRPDGPVPGRVPGGGRVARGAGRRLRPVRRCLPPDLPAYLAEAFTLGSSTVVGAASAAAGLCRRRAGDVRGLGGRRCSTCVADARETPSTSTTAYLATPSGGRVDGDCSPAPWACSRRPACCIALAPSAAIAATALLALATVLAVPLVLGGRAETDGAPRRALRAADRAPGCARHRCARRRCARWRSPRPAPSPCSGHVALGGSRENLLRGIRSFAHSYVSRRGHLGHKPRRQPGGQRILCRASTRRGSQGSRPSPACKPSREAFW